MRFPRRAARLLPLLSCAVLLLQPATVSADELPRRTPQDAYDEIARRGEVHNVQVDGDLDAAKLQPPAGATRILLHGVKLEGTLRSGAIGPPVPLWILESELRNVDLRGSRWSSPLVVEKSTIRERAWFDDAQFDSAFTLHLAVVAGHASFRAARFAGRVEITNSQFSAGPSLRSSVSFADARFAAPARFDYSRFDTELRFDATQFEADASFQLLAATVGARWRNVIFGGDADFRGCGLGDVDFAGDTLRVSVFMGRADFRGCRMRSLNLDFVDARGDMLLGNVQVSPGDVTMRQASLRGARNDLRGLRVAGKLDLEGVDIAKLQLRWSEIGPALLRPPHGAPGTELLLEIQHRLEELKRDDEAREAAAVLRDMVIEERLANPELSWADKAPLFIEQIAWGGATGYGTRLGRAAVVALLSWIVLTLPLIFAFDVRIGRLRASSGDTVPLHQPVPAEELLLPPASAVSRGLQTLAYAFALMFALPGVRLRPAEPVAAPVPGYLLFMRLAGLALLALVTLTLAKVSPVIQAILGKIAG